MTAGRTAMEYALKRRECADGYCKQADHMGKCVLRFINAENAFVGRLQMLVRPTGAKQW